MGQTLSTTGTDLTKDEETAQIEDNQLLKDLFEKNTLIVPYRSEPIKIEKTSTFDFVSLSSQVSQVLSNSIQNYWSFLIRFFLILLNHQPFNSESREIRSKSE